MICTCSLVLLLASGCSTEKANEWFVTHNGNMPTNERISRIEVGDSKEVSFDKNSWIYMSSDVRRIAFFAPEEIDRDVLTVKFNDNDEVQEISRLSKNDGEQINVNPDETEALGQEPGFFQKYFGGVGQYNPFGMRNSSAL